MFHLRYIQTTSRDFFFSINTSYVFGYVKQISQNLIHTVLYEQTCQSNVYQCHKNIESEAILPI